MTFSVKPGGISMIKRKYIIIFCMIIAVSALFGCKKESDTSEKIENNNIDDYCDVSSLREWAKTNKWQTKWTAFGESSDLQIKIDADIKVPDSD